MPDTRLAQINEIAATTGDDPELDTLLLRTPGEACRRGGALALRPSDLDPAQCLVRLREKGETVRWQPVSPTLMARLIQHGQKRPQQGHGYGTETAYSRELIAGRLAREQITMTSLLTGQSFGEPPDVAQARL